MQFGVNLIKPGISYFHVADRIESQIIEQGAKPSFPVNISKNEKLQLIIAPIMMIILFLKKEI